MSRFLSIIILLSFCLPSFAQTQFEPLVSSYNSVKDWQNKDNWKAINKTVSTLGYPSQRDIITIPTSSKLSTFYINFDLDKISTQMSFNYRKALKFDLGHNGRATFIFYQQTPSGITFNVSGALNVVGDLTLSGSQTTMLVDGQVATSGNLNFTSSAFKFTIGENGHVLVNKSFNATNGGTSTIHNYGNFHILGNFNSSQGDSYYVYKNATLNIDGALITTGGGGSDYYIYGDLSVEEDYTRIGGDEMTIYEDGFVRINGNVFSQNGGGGVFFISGDLYVQQSMTLRGGEKITIDDNGLFELRGDLYLSCSNDLIVHYKGQFIFPDESQCIILDDQCYESSSNLKLCERIEAADLPIELSYFYGTQEEDGNLLQWQTLTEINCSHYNIEYSDDNRNWTFIGRVQGQGNVNTTTNYSYLDSTAAGDYYRLVQFDFDGKSTVYGPVIFNDPNEQLNVSLYPNIVSAGSIITIVVDGSTANDAVIATLISSNGQVIKEKVLSVNIEGGYVTSFKIPEIKSKGLSFIKVFNSKNNIFFKVLIQ
ncbi:hypothetical protein [Flammeovirga sp. SubArs3]|uniref:hypothetical protein n=1 Tax=Flammeovirga sp. SubArs3 TaxID=2995316 RepID=UPI00248D29FA|nr:hypothetical protein [Flammeovirga sp. SubArs3]